MFLFAANEVIKKMDLIIDIRVSFYLQNDHKVLGLKYLKYTFIGGKHELTFKYTFKRL